MLSNRAWRNILPLVPAAFFCFSAACGVIKVEDLPNNGKYHVVSDCSDAAKKDGEATFSGIISEGTLTDATDFGFPSNTLKGETGTDGILSTGDSRHCRGMRYGGAAGHIIFACYDTQENLQCTITLNQI